MSAVAANSFGMELRVIPSVELAKQDVAMAKALLYPVAGTFVLGIASYYAQRMWSDYLDYAQKTHQSSAAANVPQKSSWAPYAKIAAGLGLTGLTAYLGSKQSPHSQEMVTHYEVSSSSGGVGSTLSPHIMISFASAYTLAPMIPAYMFLKSGFEDLKKNS